MTDDTAARLRSSALTWRELDDHIVVLDLDASVYLTVSGSGTVIWKRLVGGSTLTDIVADLVEEYDVDKQVAELDARAFLTDLRARGLLA